MTKQKLDITGVTILKTKSKQDFKKHPPTMVLITSVKDVVAKCKQCAKKDRESGSSFCESCTIKWRKKNR